VRHLRLVRRLATALRSRLPYLELDDLVSAGTIGLIEAVDRFDTGRGVAFTTFAYTRIRGAMLDEARRQRRALAINIDARGVVVLSLDATAGPRQGDLSIAEITANPMAPAPVRHAELAELLREMRGLPPRECQMLILHAQGYSVAEIAELHGCSDARASQLLTQARLRLEQRTAA
jgi:RNA polymerase sigma factor (sigma-70 family)